MRKILCVILLLSLSGCATNRRAAYNVDSTTYYDHVSDSRPQAEVTGVTYDSGPAHPTFWEYVFYKFGVE